MSEQIYTCRVSLCAHFMQSVLSIGQFYTYCINICDTFTRKACRDLRFFLRKFLGPKIAVA